MPPNPEIRGFFENASATFARTVHPYASRRRGEALAAHASGRILEVGCGSGAVTAHLAPKGDVVAGDVAPGMVKATRSAARVPGVVFDGEAFPFRDRSFDAVVCAEAIYYLDHPSRLIREAHRVLHAGGTLALSCPPLFWQRMDRLRVRLARLGFKWGSQVPMPAQELPVRELNREMEAAGFRADQPRPMILIPFEAWDRVNRILERTPVAALSLFRELVGRKPRSH